MTTYKTLVLGGIRSGKSRFAERLAIQSHLPVTYIATATIEDAEMHARIALLRANRPTHWQVIEEPLNLANLMGQLADEQHCLLVDCLTLWLSNVFLHPERDAATELDALVALVGRWNGPDLALVTNEVGCGIVPENALAREFRDLAGRMNQRLAEASDEVYWTVFGQPLRIKPSGGLR